MVPKVSQQYASLVNKVPIAMQNFKIKKKYSLRASNNSREPPLAPSYVFWKKKKNDESRLEGTFSFLIVCLRLERRLYLSIW